MVPSLSLIEGITVLGLIAVMAVAGWGLCADKLRDRSGAARSDVHSDEVPPQTASGPGSVPPGSGGRPGPLVPNSPAAVMNDPYGAAEADAHTLPMVPAGTDSLPVVEDPAPSGPRHARPRNWWRIARITATAAALLLCIAATGVVVVSAASSNGVDGSQWASPRASSTADTVREPVPATTNHRTRSPGVDRAKSRRLPVLPAPTRRRTPTPRAAKPSAAPLSPSPKPSKAKPTDRPRVVPAPSHTTPKPGPSRTCPPTPGGGDR